MKKPRPCPECGAKLVFVCVHYFPKRLLRTRHVECDECYYCGPTRLTDGGAIRAWNREAKKVQIEPCPSCGGEPRLVQCGDQKELLVYRCSKCGKTPVRSCEARSAERGARKVWNRRAKHG